MAITSRAFDGKRLRALRDAKGWSQGELGRRIGAHTTSVSDWERGSNAPSGRHVAGLSREFGVGVEQFYDENGTPDEDDEESDVAAVLMRALDRYVHARTKQAVA